MGALATEAGTIISCFAPYGEGGLGQHLAQIIEENRRRGALRQYFCSRPLPEDNFGCCIALSWTRSLQFTPLRFLSDHRVHLSNELFDRAVSKSLLKSIEFIGFAGMSLRTLKRARDLGVQTLSLESPTAHISHVFRQHENAYKDSFEERSWLSLSETRKILKEYKTADVIYVTSDYAFLSFLHEGIPASKLRKRSLQINSRFKPQGKRFRDGVFRIVYVGRLATEKGIPLLIKAFSELPGNAELTLVGGSGTYKMHKYLQRAQAQDPRIKITVGDPLPYLSEADVYVHPSYQDGFGYAPMEALACGTPVIVSEDTGMKEYVREGKNGYVTPTGSWTAILERLEWMRKHHSTRFAVLP